MKTDRPHSFGPCEQVRAWTHRLLDDDPALPLVGEEFLQRQRHLDACESCRLEADELQTIQQELRELGVESLPDTVLESVLAQTIRKRSRWRPTFSLGVDWRLAAAAGVALVLVGVTSYVGPGLVQPGPGVEGTHSVAELEQAARDARVALAVTSRALRRSSDAALRARSVIRDEVSTALREIPIQWPTMSTDNPRGGGDV